MESYDRSHPGKMLQIKEVCIFIMTKYYYTLNPFRFCQSDQYILLEIDAIIKGWELINMIRDQR